MKTRLIFILALSFVCSVSFSQDKIYKKGGEMIKAKVTEIGTGEVKYTLFNKTGGPVYVIDKSKIEKIEFEDGHTETYLNNLKDPELYKDQKKNALKVNFLSPLLINDLDLLSRPVSYINFKGNAKDNKNHRIELYLGVSSNLAVNSRNQIVKAEKISDQNLLIVKAGTLDQQILKKKGDDVKDRFHDCSY